MLEIGLLLAGAFVAGLVDAVVGGGGLIQIPLLFGVFPGASPAAIFGTNKLASVFGTASAAARYARQVAMPWRAALPAAATAFVASFLGAMAVSFIPTAILKPAVLALLVAVAIYTWWRKDFGREDERRVLGKRHMLLASLIGGAIGFYDGFFGPGTGSFLIFLFIRGFGLDFLRASSAAKVVNVMTNIAALIWFGASGQINWTVGLGMAVFNVAGAQVGARLAMRHGTGFVRKLFLGVVSVLILRFGWELLGQG